MRHPEVGSWSPWGSVQHVQVVVPGHIYVVTTASHGGMKLSAEYNRLVDPSWRVKGGWYEEDVDVAIVIITFQKSFAAKADMDEVRSVLARHYAKEYSDWWPQERDTKALFGLDVYDAAEVSKQGKQAIADLSAMLPKLREKRPARIFESEHGGVKRIQIDPGDTVLCDFCNADWTDRPESGGFVFSGSAVCPTCAPVQLKKIKGYGEEDAIQGYCPSGMSFADWVRSMRR
jgi:hypothetical protein